MRKSAKLGVVVVASLATIALIAPASHHQDPEPPPAPPATEALAQLGALPVKGRAPSTGYDRDRFGPAWADVDHNHCNTRDDILRRDLTQTTLRDPCVVLTGVLLDPYSGRTIAFQRGEGTSLAVQVDHVVPLSNAWQTGAQQLSALEREVLANDPDNLLAVDGPLNQEKSDSDAASWLPPRRAYWCPYVTRQVQVKARYRLWVTPAEHDAIEGVLRSC